MYDNYVVRKIFGLNWLIERRQDWQGLYWKTTHLRHYYIDYIFSTGKLHTWDTTTLITLFLLENCTLETLLHWLPCFYWKTAYLKHYYIDYIVSTGKLHTWDATTLITLFLLENYTLETLLHWLHSFYWKTTH